MINPETVPFTGMFIPKSPARETIEDLVTNAYREWKINSDSVRATELMDQIGKMPNVKLVKAIAYGEYPFLRCATYVFGSHFDEPWCRKYDVELMHKFWEDPIDFLSRRGFQVADQAEFGNVLGYIDPQFGFQHWGIYEGNGMVVSKFDYGHVFKHPVESVPSGYGNEIVCFRKTQPKPISALLA